MNEENSWYQKTEISGARQFLYLVLLGIGGFVLMGLISFFILLSHYGLNNFASIDMQNMPAGLVDYLMIVQDVCMFAVPAIIFAMIVKRRDDYFYIRKKSAAPLWLLAILIAVAALFVSDLLGTLTEHIPLSKSATDYFQKMEDSYNEQAVSLLNFKTFGNFVFSVIMIALLPAIFEELFFRGALQQVMLKWTKNVWAAIIITAIIFSAIHMSYYGFLSRAMLGVVLGFVYYYGKNIWLNMLIHFINNATVVVSLYIEYGSKPLDAKALSDNSSVSPWYLQAIGVVVLIAALNAFIKKSNREIINHTS